MSVRSPSTVTIISRFISACCLAAALIDPTDYATLGLNLGLARAEVARLAGRSDEERRQLQTALELADAKTNRLAAGRIREQLERLAPG